jgi:hypothetical protein
MTSIEPELWVEPTSAAVAFYQSAFGATVIHQVGDGDESSPHHRGTARLAPVTRALVRRAERPCEHLQHSRGVWSLAESSTSVTS